MPGAPRMPACSLGVPVGEPVTRGGSDWPLMAQPRASTPAHKRQEGPLFSGGSSGSSSGLEAFSSNGLGVGGWISWAWVVLAATKTAMAIGSQRTMVGSHGLGHACLD